MLFGPGWRNDDGRGRRPPGESGEFNWIAAAIMWGRRISPGESTRDRVVQIFSRRSHSLLKSIQSEYAMTEQAMNEQAIVETIRAWKHIDG